jgi:diaminopimelate decarboxylase
MHPDVSDFLGQASLVHHLVDVLGSPLNVVFPDRVTETITEFQRVLREEQIDGSVLYTTKPNRSQGLIREVALVGTPVDVSSAGAMVAALAAGIPGWRIHASGPKDVEYLGLACQHGATICVDSFEELRILRQLSTQGFLRERVRCLVRLSGFQNGSSSIASHGSVFGIPVARTAELVESLCDARDWLECEGFAHHLPLPSNRERISALEDTLEVFIAAQRRGLRPRVINIGGGFRINYAASQEEWQRFQSYLKASIVGQVKPVTWNGSGLGYQISDKGIIGSPAFQEHFVSHSGAEQLRLFLSERLPRFDNAPVGRVLQDMLIHLEVEPGRAILNQAGISIGRVATRKENARGDFLLSLEMNHSNIRSSEQKLLTQPIFLPRGERERDPRGVYLVGNLCIPNDLIQYQKVYPGSRAERGDLFVFVNTAAYLMDFVESPVLHQPVARKVTAIRARNGWRWSLDEEYSPVRRMLEEYL